MNHISTEIAALDLKTARDSPLWSEAVDFLSTAWNPESREKSKRIFLSDPDDWWIGHHHQGGRRTRNALRGAGFGEGEFCITNLDNIYVKLLEEAMMR